MNFGIKLKSYEVHKALTRTAKVKPNYKGTETAIKPVSTFHILRTSMSTL